MESIKLIHEFTLPYVERERRRLGSECQPALLITDVFRRQMTQPVWDLLKENDILLVRVPANMTHIFQPLDLTVNRSAKSFFKRKFTEWYSNELKLQLETGTKLDNIEVKLNLTTLKPLHSTWIIEFYNKMTSNEGKPIIQNGWKSDDIEDNLEMGKGNIPSLDPFFDIDPLLAPPIIPITPQAVMDEEILASMGLLSYNEEDDKFNDDDVWVIEGEDITGERNAFDVFVDEDDDL